MGGFLPAESGEQKFYSSPSSSNSLLLLIIPLGRPGGYEREEVILGRDPRRAQAGRVSYT